MRAAARPYATLQESGVFHRLSATVSAAKLRVGGLWRE